MTQANPITAFSQPPAPAVHTPTGATAAVSAKSQRMLGIDERFSDLHRIGGGGSSEVFSGWDQQRGEVVAIKRLGSQHTNRQEDKDAFELEFDILQSLDHAAIPQAFEFFPERMFKPYFTMERLQGFTLCRVLHGLRNEIPAMVEAFPLSRMLEIVEIVADCLAVAHDRDIVHRDIKPENIMIADDDRISLIDWGTAFKTNESETTETKPVSAYADRRKECILGSPLYMPPEQTYPQADLDGRADVFSLGAVLYDCLALTTLNPGQSVGEAIAFTRTGQYAPPSKVTMRPEVPQQLDELCMSAVAPKRQDRIQDMPTFCQSLNECRSTHIA